MNEIEKKLLDEIKKDPFTECTFCGTKNRKRIILVNKKDASIIDANSPFFSCINPNCEPAQKAQKKIKWKIPFLIKSIEFLRFKIANVSIKDSIFLKEIQPELDRFKDETKEIENLSKKKEYLFTNWEKLKQRAETTWIQFFEWRKKHVSFISLEIHLDKNNKQWSKNNKLWKWSIAIASISLVVGIVSLIV